MRLDEIGKGMNTQLTFEQHRTVQFLLYVDFFY